MADTTETPAETEERIENALCTALSTVCTIPVEGAMNPATSGNVKRLSAETFISVIVDQSSQDGDYRGNRVPHSYAARVIVHFALSDDADGALFRAECRIVRAALTALTGDGCATLGADGFACDALTIDSTSTSFEAGENPTNTKTYTATVKGRTLTTNTESSNG